MKEHKEHDWVEMGLGIGIVLLAAGWAGSMIVDEINDTKNTEPTPVPTPTIETDIRSFENSFNTALQLKPTPQP